MTFHFITGLPRSGSTLLAALLRQNPRFHADMTSGIGSLVGGAMQIIHRTFQAFPGHCGLRANSTAT